nr:DUF2726 domain-containing protein [Pseudacidovorax intermedius]
MAARRGPRQSEPIKAKRFLTDREQAMFNRLKEAFPSLTVVTQVSFGALLSARKTATRNRFDRKIADFAVLDHAYRVIALIELDDATHRLKKDADTARDDMLKGAGYRVLRYTNVPNISDVRADVFPPASEPQREPRHASNDGPSEQGFVAPSSPILARPPKPEPQRPA